MEKDEACALARASAFAKAQKALKKKGVTFERVAQRLKEGLDAEEIKTAVDKFGDWNYSKPLVSHGTRMVAVKLAAQLLDMEPDKNVNVEVRGIEDILRKLDEKS